MHTRKPIILFRNASSVEFSLQSMAGGSGFLTGYGGSDLITSDAATVYYIRDKTKNKQRKTSKMCGFIEFDGNNLLRPLYS